MAEITRTTKSGNLIIEHPTFIGIGQNLNDTSKPTTRYLGVKFQTEKGTEISFRLYKDEVAFIKKEILKWEQEKEYFKKHKAK